MFKFFDWIYIAAACALVAFFGWSCWNQPTFDTLSTLLFGSMIVGALIGIRSSVKIWRSRVAELERTLARLEQESSAGGPSRAS